LRRGSPSTREWTDAHTSTIIDRVTAAAEVRTAPSPKWLAAAAVVLGCVVGQSFGRFSFGLLLPAVKKDLAVSYGLAGWLGTMNLGAYAVGTALTSIASVRVPPHRIMQFGVGLATVGITILTVAPSTPFLLFGMTCCGLGGAASWVPAPGIAASQFPPERRGFAMGLCSAGIGIGIVLATFLTDVVRSVVGDEEAWRQVWAVQAAIGLLVTIFALRMIRPAPVMAGAPPRLSVLMQVPSWWAATAAYVFFGLGYVLFAVFVVAALVQDAGFSARHASQVFAFFGLGSAIGALSIGRLSDRVGRRPTMIVCFAAASLPCIAVIAGREPWVSLGGVLFGISMSGAVVSIAAHIGDHTRPQDFSAAFGVVTLAFSATQMIGPRLGGYMADHNGNFDDVFRLSAVCWLTGACLAARMRRRTRVAPTISTTLP
jgi:predicted MFS family arabinose efflux permease